MVVTDEQRKLLDIIVPYTEKYGVVGEEAPEEVKDAYRKYIKLIEQIDDSEIWHTNEDLD